MLSIIKKNNVGRLYQKYPYLMDFEQHIFLHEFKNEYYILPRYFLRNHPNANDIVSIFIDNEFKGKSIDIEFNGALRPDQIPIVSHMLSLFETNGYVNGILKAKPGFGKTICSAYIVSALKKKTLIVLNNSKLVEQWNDAFLNFTSLTADDIGFIIGKQFSPKLVTITMVQTLLSKTKKDIKEFYKKMRDEGFDLVFFDETHRTSAGSKYALSSLFLNTKNIIGLTATPYGDLLHSFFMKNIIGDIIYEFVDYDTIPEIYFINYKSQLGSKYFWRVAKIKDYIGRIGYYNKILYQSPVYLEIITKLCKKIVKSERKVIIIVSTLDQLNAVVTALEHNNIPAKKLYSKEQDIDKEKDNVIVATYKLASHGFDYAELSCLILATPLKGKTSLIQTVGRILRKYHNKKTPIVFDLIDYDFQNIFKSMVPTKQKILTKEFNIEKFHTIDFNI